MRSKLNLKAAILYYKGWAKKNPDPCISHCKAQVSLLDAIHVAAKSIDARGKRHSHQYRQRPRDMKNFAIELQYWEDKIKAAEDFDILFKLVNNIGRKVYGTGEMLIYDVTERIGAYLNLYPEKIYLHAGTRIGVERLMGKIQAQSINKSELPEPLASCDLTCAELESFFCTFKKYI